MTEVVAALICQGDAFMIFQRPAEKARGLLWEFAGGKVEPGETCAQALIRECQEELGIEISVGPVLAQVVHAYPDLTIHLTLFRAVIANGTPKKLEHKDFRWITAADLPQYQLCPADAAIAQALWPELGICITTEEM